jgi:hypothetical protein
VALKIHDVDEYRRVMDAAIAAYEANTPASYRYSATALMKAVEAALGEFDAEKSSFDAGWAWAKKMLKPSDLDYNDSDGVK